LGTGVRTSFEGPSRPVAVSVAAMHAEAHAKCARHCASLQFLKTPLSANDNFLYVGPAVLSKNKHVRPELERRKLGACESALRLVASFPVPARPVTVPISSEGNPAPIPNLVELEFAGMVRESCYASADRALFETPASQAAGGSRLASAGVECPGCPLSALDAMAGHFHMRASG
jgi:hypothetical protein